MKSWQYSIWLKRLAPVIVLVGLWFVYQEWQSHQAAREEAYDLKIATTAAYLYIGSARYRDNPETYTIYRDSVLFSLGVTPEEIDSYPDRYEGFPERYQRFADLMGDLVDSLYRHEDSARIRLDSVQDSVLQD